MVVLIVSLRDWDEENQGYDPDWPADFFEVGGLETVDDPDYIVDDVDYCIDYDNDMVAGVGDAGDPQPTSAPMEESTASSPDPEAASRSRALGDITSSSM